MKTLFFSHNAIGISQLNHKFIFLIQERNSKIILKSVLYTLILKYYKFCYSYCN